MDLLTILLGGYFISSLADSWGDDLYEDDSFDDFDDCDDFDEYYD